MWGRGQVLAHLYQPGMFSVWWLFQGIAKPLKRHSTHAVSLALLCVVRRGEELPGTTNNARGWRGVLKYDPYLTDEKNKLREGK